MSFYSLETINKIKNLEEPPKIYKNVFSNDEIKSLIRLEKESHSLRMVDRDDSRKTKIEWQTKVEKIVRDKLENVIGHKIWMGDFPAHFILNKYPLRIHADMGKDASVIPHKNILIPLFVNGASTTHTILFKNRWYGQSSLFSKNFDSKDHYFKDRSGKFVHITNSDEFLNTLKNSNQKIVEYADGMFKADTDTIGQVEALLKQSRYSQRTNKHITSNKPFNRHDYQKYLTHQPYEDLNGLEIDTVVAWKPGDVVTFDRSTIHCASNFLKEGVTSKMAMVMFTVWREDV